MTVGIFTHRSFQGTQLHIGEVVPNTVIGTVASNTTPSVRSYGVPELE